MPFDNVQKIEDQGRAPARAGDPYIGDRAPTGDFAVVECPHCNCRFGEWLRKFSEEGMAGTRVRVHKGLSL